MPSEDTLQGVSLEVARLLRNERIRRGISMRQLADKSGLSQPMVSYVERGKCNPTLDTLLRMANALDLDLSKLIKRASGTRNRSVSQR